MLVCLNLQRNGTGSSLSNIADTFAESFQLQISVLNQSLCIFKAGLSSLCDSWENINKKYLICQIPVKILKQHAIPNSSLQNLKISSSKEYRRTSRRWIMYVANTAILELRFFSERYHFRLWVFGSSSEYFYCWHWRVTIT